MYISPNVNLSLVATATNLALVQAGVTSTLADIATLLGRLTATRAGYLDRLTLIAAGGAGELTAARSALLTNLDAAITTRAGSINSMQRGTVAITNGATTGTVTVSAVTLAKSLLSHLGNMYGTSDGAGQSMPIIRIELTNTTTISAYASQPVYGGDTIGYELVGYA